MTGTENSGVYFVKHPRNGLIKIGWTLNLRERIVALSRECGGPVSLELFISAPYPYPRQLESVIHTFFYWKRFRGEWFDIARHEMYWVLIELPRLRSSLRSGGILRFFFNSRREIALWRTRPFALNQEKIEATRDKRILLRSQNRPS